MRTAARSSGHDTPNHVFFLTDSSDPAGMEDGEPAMRLHILGPAGDGDYYIQVAPQESQACGPAVRFRTSGSSDANVAMFVAALYHYLAGNYERSSSCAKAASETAAELAESRKEKR